MKRDPLFPPTDPRRIVTISDLAQATGLKKDSIWRSAVRGEIPGAMRNGPRTQWYFERKSIEKWWLTVWKTNRRKSNGQKKK